MTNKIRKIDGIDFTMLKDPSACQLFVIRKNLSLDNALELTFKKYNRVKLKKTNFEEKSPLYSQKIPLLFSSKSVKLFN